MQKIKTCLWFDNQAEEAVSFYISIFKNSAINQIVRYTEVGPGEAGSIMTVTFTLDGEEFMALNGGPHFTFSPAISVTVSCKTQDEIDELWEKLSEGGEKSQCGWVTDKFGLSWQITPTLFDELPNDADPAAVNRVMESLLKMTKLDIAELEKAYKGN